MLIILPTKVLIITLKQPIIYKKNALTECIFL